MEVWQRCVNNALRELNTAKDAFTYFAYEHLDQWQVDYACEQFNGAATALERLLDMKEMYEDWYLWAMRFPGDSGI